MAFHHHNHNEHDNCSTLMKHIKNVEDIKGFEDFLSDALKSEGLRNAEKFIEEIQIEKQKVGKNSDKSTALRLEARELLEKVKTVGDLINVLRVNNTSIAYAPNQSRELALSYGHRSVVLFLLKHYNECLADINRALGLNYPDQMTEELLVYKVRCMKMINHPDLQIIYNDCFKWIDKHSKDPKQSRVALKKAYKAKTQPNPTGIQFRDELLEEMKKSCPNLEKVAIKESNHGGLATLIAAKDINVGEVIAVQKIWAQTLTMEKRCLACWQCLVICFNPIPCHSCTTVMYCSESCKAEAWSKHHEYECQFSFAIQRFIPDLAFSIRTCLTAMKQLGGILPLMKEVLKMSKVEDTRKEQQIVDGSYPSDSYRSVYLLKNEYNFTACDLVEAAKKASLFSHYVATGTTFFNKQYQGDWLQVMEERVPKFFASLLLRHDLLFRRLPRNVLHLSYDIKLMTADLCPLFTFLKHSCNPNSAKLTLKTHQVMIAVNEIKKGQEINFSFTGTALVEDTKVQRTRITEALLPFSCECEVCMMKKPPKVLPLWMLEKNKKKLKELTVLDHKIRDTISEHQSSLPNTAAEFLQQKAELCENLRPFFASAPSLCKEVVWLKNYLIKDLTMQFAKRNHNF